MSETEALEIARALAKRVHEKVGTDPTSVLREIQAACEADPDVDEAVRQVGYMVDAARTHEKH